jgi:hypothetical protein
MVCQLECPDQKWRGTRSGLRRRVVLPGLEKRRAVDRGGFDALTRRMNGGLLTSQEATAALGSLVTFGEDEAKRASIEESPVEAME